MGLLALSLNITSFPFALRLVVDLIRQGSIFSYIVVEVVWLCEFPCLVKFLYIDYYQLFFGFFGCQADLMPPGQIVNLRMHSRANQLAILGFSVGVTLH